MAETLPHGKISPPMDLAARRILVTGGHGFLGQQVVRRLTAAGCRQVDTPTRSDADLRDPVAVDRLLRAVRPEVVIHCAAVVGGIGGNRARPGEFCYDNLVMGAHLMEYARRAGVAKFVGLGTICSYPRDTPVPFREDTLWDGYPEPTNAPYGLAKKMLLVQGQAYRAQYGFNAIHLLPVNLYGPGDDFDPATSHVIPALIRRCLEAEASGAPEVAVWGDGTATREFLYVEDAAEAIVLATAHYDDPEPVNIGSGSEIAIRELAQAIATATGFRGTLRWDTSQPNGQQRRRLETSRAERAFGFRASTPFAEGLARTVAWYRAQPSAMV